MTRTNSFTVVYRTGGTHDCRWKRVLFTFPTRDEAQLKATDLEKAGYKAHVYPTDLLNHVGLPVGWTMTSVDWDHDYVQVSPNETHHVVRAVADDDEPHGTTPGCANFRGNV